MKRQKVIDLTAEILLHYYDNDVSLFLENTDENILWYGPAEGQFLRGKEALISAWTMEQAHPLTFTMNSLKIDMVSPGPALCITVAHFSVVTHYPSGNDIAINQRVSFTWHERMRTDEKGRRIGCPRILLCDITNPHPKSPDDTIYPVHFEQIYSGFTTMPERGKRLHFRGYGQTECYLFSDTVMWGESCANGQRSLLHLTDGTTAEIILFVRDVTRDHPDLFLRCHSSFFVNPDHVRSLRRFTVSMRCGTELPVPEKSYTHFRKAMEEAIRKRSGSKQEKEASL